MISPYDSLAEFSFAVGVLRHERGELLCSREIAFEIKRVKAGELRESRDAATHLGTSEVEVLKLGEVLKEG